MVKTKWIALTLVGLMLLTTMIGAYAIYHAVSRDQFDTVWSYSSSDKDSSGLLFLGPDGTIYAREYSDSAQPDGRHFSYLVALDSEGELKWRYGLNAQPWPTLGADGGIYYVDWQDISTWIMNSSYYDRGWSNLTVLNADGSLRWEHVMDNGSMEIETISDEGAVMVRYSLYNYNSTSNQTNSINKIIFFSPDGDIVWQLDNPYEGHEIYNARFVENGTIELDSFLGDDRWTLGFTPNGEEIYRIKGNEYFYVNSGRFSRNATASFDVRQIPIDLNTTVVSVYAVNISDGKVLWNTTLRTGDNPDHNPPGGGWMGWDAYVDKDNVVYAHDGEGHNLFAMDRNGTILWHHDFSGVQIGVFPSGGVLIWNESSFTRVDATGEVAWKCHGNFDYVEFNIHLITPDENIITIADDAIVELSPETEAQWNGMALIYMVIATGVMMVLGISAIYLVRSKDK